MNCYRETKSMITRCNKPQQHQPINANEVILMTNQCSHWGINDQSMRRWCLWRINHRLSIFMNNEAGLKYLHPINGQLDRWRERCREWVITSESLAVVKRWILAKTKTRLEWQRARARVCVCVCAGTDYLICPMSEYGQCLLYLADSRHQFGVVQTEVWILTNNNAYFTKSA